MIGDLIIDIIGDLCQLVMVGILTYVTYLAYYALYIVLDERLLNNDKKGKH